MRILSVLGTLKLRKRCLSGIRHNSDSLTSYYFCKFIGCWRSNDQPCILVDTIYSMWQKSRISSMYVVFHDRPASGAPENPQMVHIYKVEGKIPYLICEMIHRFFSYLLPIV